jgi:pimeloyl-ACP methyl ester carboxylesterase
VIRSVQRCPGGPALSFIEGEQGGPPLLFLHGVGRCSADFLRFTEALVPHWHVHALDFRGHRASEHAASYLVVDYVGDTQAFVQSHFAEPIVLYGHSLGAMVALAVAAELPSAIRALILEDPPFHTMGRNVFSTPWHPLFLGMRQVSRDNDDISTIVSALSEIRVLPGNGEGLTRLGNLRSRESLQFSGDCLSQLDPEVFTPIIEGRWLSGYDEKEFFARVRCPVLILQADPSAGGAMTDADAELALATMAHCRRVQFRGTGHLIHRDQADAVIRAITEFTSTLAKRGNRDSISTSLPS